MTATTPTEFSFEDLSDEILPSQYQDLVKRDWSISEGEFRLLWAVLEDAIKIYLANRACSSRGQRSRFEEIRRWFEPSQNRLEGLFGYRTICDLLEIDADWLLRGLNSSATRDLRLRRSTRSRGRWRGLAA